LESLDPNAQYFMLDGKIGSLSFSKTKNKFVEDNNYNEEVELTNDEQRSN
jgi:hypothetical protein